MQHVGRDALSWSLPSPMGAMTGRIKAWGRSSWVGAALTLRKQASQPRYCPLSKGLLTRHWIWPDKQKSVNYCKLSDYGRRGTNQNPSASCIIHFEEAQSIQGGTMAKLFQRNSKEAAKLKVFQKRRWWWWWCKGNNNNNTTTDSNQSPDSRLQTSDAVLSPIPLG
jgi:hypothetical protein